MGIETSISPSDPVPATGTRRLLPKKEEGGGLVVVVIGGRAATARALLGRVVGTGAACVVGLTGRGVCAAQFTAGQRLTCQQVGRAVCFDGFAPRISG